MGRWEVRATVAWHGGRFSRTGFTTSTTRSCHSELPEREELSSTTTGVTTDPCCSIEITSRYVGLSNSSDAAANCCRRSSIAALGRILAQEVFLPTLKYPPTYRDDGRFETWLFRIGIARNARADDCRKRTRAMPLTDEALGQPVPDAGPVLHHRMWPTRGATAGGHQADRTHRGSSWAVANRSRRLAGFRS